MLKIGIYTKPSNSLRHISLWLREQRPFFYIIDFEKKICMSKRGIKNLFFKSNIAEMLYK